jgi:hypothetical protein
MAVKPITLEQMRAVRESLDRVVRDLRKTRKTLETSAKRKAA